MNGVFLNAGKLSQKYCRKLNTNIYHSFTLRDTMEPIGQFGQME